MASQRHQGNIWLVDFFKLNIFSDCQKLENMYTFIDSHSH
jgi:hypothetical protein